MKRVITTGPKLIAGLILLLGTSSLVAGSQPASYVKPDVDLSVYKRVMVEPLNMDNIEILKPAWEQDNDEEWSFEPEDLTIIQKMFMDAMEKEIECKGDYALVDEPADDVIRIEVELLSITPYIKPGTVSDDSEYEVTTLGSGDVVASAEFRDSQTRELLIVIEGERAIGDEYKELTRENHIENLENLFAQWGKRVRTGLDKARDK